MLNGLRVCFPRLTSVNSRPTSPIDPSYNCIAWAAEDEERWWWPDPQNQKYWPEQIPREESLNAFVRAYGLFGFTETADSILQHGKEKIAIYTDSNGIPTHASRQLPNGRWTSKLGKHIDIEHEFDALDGPAYGTVAVVLARGIQGLV